MKHRSQTKYLGVLRYKEETDPKFPHPMPSGHITSKTIFPDRWTQGTREERIANILIDLPEACFRSNGLLLDTLRAIHNAMEEQRKERETDAENKLRNEGESAGKQQTDGMENEQSTADNQATNQQTETTK